MSIEIRVGDKAIKKNNNKLRDYKFSLDIRQTLGGDYVIYDHPDIDIVIMPKLKKVCSVIYIGSKIWLIKIIEQEKIINQEIIGFLFVGFSSAKGKKNIQNSILSINLVLFIVMDPRKTLLPSKLFFEMILSSLSLNSK